MEKETAGRRRLPLFAKKCALCGRKMTVFENIWVEKVQGEVCMDCYRKLTDEVENQGANAPEPEKSEQAPDNGNPSDPANANVEARLKAMEGRFNKLMLFTVILIVAVLLCVFMALANR